MNSDFSKQPKIQELLNFSKEVNALVGVASLLEWDQETMMPIKADIFRAKQQALISTIAHNKFVAKENEVLISELEIAIKNAPESYTTFDKSLVRVFRRNYDNATKLPSEFVTKITEHTSRSVESWRRAREKSDFSIFEADLQKMFELKIELAELLGYKENPYDALLDQFEEGLTTKEVIGIFEPLKEFSIDLLTKIQNSSVKVDSSILNRKYNKSAQVLLNEQIAAKLGFDFDAGRLDPSTHPFTTEFGTSKDVRITTRYFEDQIQASIMGTIHETGHALYEQGVLDVLDMTELGQGVSLGIHESQSRMWENFVGKTPEFWQYWFPNLVSLFPESLELTEEDAFVKAINKVSPTFIRVEADEVTYNLHIILRFEIENALINKEIEVKDLPQVWNEKMQKYLGITPPNDAQGVLQDIHWASGAIGYFPTYSLGNLYAAQFWGIIEKDIPNLKQNFKEGDYAILLNWLRERIHQFGSVYTAQELCTRITGKSLEAKYLKTYLKEKYSEIYKL